MEEIKNLKLISQDKVTVEINERAAVRSKLVKNNMDLYPDQDEIPINEVKGSTLKLIKTYLEHYEKEEPKKIKEPLISTNYSECVDKFDFDFINIPLEELYELTVAANYMEIIPLLHLCCSKIASFCQGKTTEEMRTFFGIENDFTKEEEDELREESKWCYEEIDREKSDDE